ncbi:MAG: hypothetical protein DME25_14510, partial [Verrucomicrobia bacterium]
MGFEAFDDAAIRHHKSQRRTRSDPWLLYDGHNGRRRHHRLRHLPQTRQVGSPELLLGVWVLAGVITLFGVLTNAEIASMIPETGGQYIYFERMYGPFFAFLYGWGIFAVMQSGSIAAVSYVFAEYANQFVKLPEFSESVAAWCVHLPFIGDVAPLKEIGTKGLAAALIILLTAVNYLGVKFGGLVQNIFTIGKVAAMVLLMLGVLFLPT